ncbi:MAG: creatininase family protein [Acidobacteriaceae bacterium]|nr:creatininase family protein [Acidobacteriaceae bacterium]
MKFVVFLLAAALMLGSALKAQTNSLLIEDMTWTEVRGAIASGKTTAIYYAGSIEQNGPGVALGKHVFIAHYLAPKIAAQLGNALVYPTMPFAPTGSWGLTAPGSIDPAKKTGHMRYPGSVNLSEETFAAVAHDVALSAISAGFKNVVLMCDHGGPAQSRLAEVAEEMNKDWAGKGIHIYYIPDLYFKEKQVMKDYMRKHGLPEDQHAGTDDTSEVMYVDEMVNGRSSKWVRRDALINGHDGDRTGVVGDQTKATADLGKMFTDAKVSFAVQQIKQLIASGK